MIRLIKRLPDLEDVCIKKLERYSVSYIGTILFQGSSLIMMHREAEKNEESYTASEVKLHPLFNFP